MCAHITTTKVHFTHSVHYRNEDFDELCHFPLFSYKIDGVVNSLALFAEEFRSLSKLHFVCFIHLSVLLLLPLPLLLQYQFHVSNDRKRFSLSLQSSITLGSTFHLMIYIRTHALNLRLFFLHITKFIKMSCPHSIFIHQYICLFFLAFSFSLPHSLFCSPKKRLLLAKKMISNNLIDA